MVDNQHDWSFYRGTRGAQQSATPRRSKAAVSPRSSSVPERRIIERVRRKPRWPKDRERIDAQDVKRRITEMVLLNPHISVDEIEGRLNTASTVSRVLISDIKAEVRHTLKVADELGLLKRPFDVPRRSSDGFR